MNGTPSGLSRREFLAFSALATGGLVLAAWVVNCSVMPPASR